MHGHAHLAGADGEIVQDSCDEFELRADYPAIRARSGATGRTKAMIRAPFTGRMLRLLNRKPSGCQQAGGMLEKLPVVFQKVHAGHAVLIIALDAEIFNFRAGAKSDALAAAEGKRELGLVRQ